MSFKIFIGLFIVFVIGALFRNNRVAFNFNDTYLVINVLDAAILVVLISGALVGLKQLFHVFMAYG
ncbi:hypothetical protein [Maribacter sp. 2-571]|uniref:hypothetical protein n=1 Tax=Maribacter sp. 2-571 TaxID=3417569 RepID=UPI003D339AD5